MEMKEAKIIAVTTAGSQLVGTLARMRMAMLRTTLAWEQLDATLKTTCTIKMNIVDDELIQRMYRAVLPRLGRTTPYLALDEPWRRQGKRRARKPR